MSFLIVMTCLHIVYSRPYSTWILNIVLSPLHRQEESPLSWPKSVGYTDNAIHYTGRTDPVNWICLSCIGLTTIFLGHLDNRKPSG